LADPFLIRTVPLDGDDYRYAVWVPPGWRGAANPASCAILFLHGSGERGEDGEAHLGVGLPNVLRQDPARYPALVVLPQCRPRRWWTDPAMQSQALAALAAACAEFGAASRAPAVTGLSMGGYGVWSLAERYPGRFRALAPVCGGLNLPAGFRAPGVERDETLYDRTARAVGATTPVWIFHGAKDDVVSADESRRMEQALRQLGASPRYTEYAEAGHNSWDLAYWEPALPAWLAGLA
jgi:predicted peptidase